MITAALIALMLVAMACGMVIGYCTGWKHGARDVAAALPREILSNHHGLRDAIRKAVR